MAEPKHHGAFILSHGWTILFLLVVTGILAYLGIVNPDIVPPEKCILQLGLNCEQHAVGTASNTVSLTLQNSRNNDIILSQLNITGDNFVGCYADENYRPFSNEEKGGKGWLLPAGAEGKINVHCDDIYSSGGKLSAKIQIKYSNSDANDVFVRTINGELFAAAHQDDEYCCCDASAAGIEYNFWAKKISCYGINGSVCTRDSFHTCGTVQQRCCAIGRLYFWGDGNCSGYPQDNSTTEDSCEY
jgi:hypothetical protein